MMLVVVLVTTADHVVDHEWSVLIMIWTMDIYISKNTKLNADLNDTENYTEIYALSSLSSP